ncbi:MAG: TetR/AcrR family transcriptional regulator [Micavibrio aeruginosavorus]|uniref:TetR/AcrR family transcriptional regulator n=1 Tax=Micavibrio aeruginosavorus TaxID=349221 RepID=A0A7T5UHL4_9BACT|nr:MAG: TetR/AcrR family transcriptional regulator [Micavibrio aeruginosavorus]
MTSHSKECQGGLAPCGEYQDNPKRRAILEAAARLFLERGFTATSMDAIAEAAPVSKPTLYSHFKDKGDLFGAVINGRCCSLMKSLYEHVNAEESIETSLRAIAESFFDLIYAAEAISLYRIIISELNQFPMLGQTLYSEGPTKILCLLSAFFAQQNEKGVLSLDDPEMAARLFLSMLKGDYHMQCLLGIKQSISPEERARIIDAAIPLFIAGYRNRTKS